MAETLSEPCPWSFPHEAHTFSTEQKDLKFYCFGKNFPEPGKKSMADYTDSLYTSCEDTEPHNEHVTIVDGDQRMICIGRGDPDFVQEKMDRLDEYKDRISEEVRTTSSTGGEKGVKGARFDLIPVGPLTQLAKLYGKGAEKYDSHNWRKGYEWSKSYAAMMRHATQFWNGEDYDEEMGLPHLTSVIFHAMALLEFMEEHPDFDDRHRSPTNPSDEALAELRKKLTGGPYSA